MKLNWISYYPQQDGYGRFSSRLVRALVRQGVQVKVATMDHVPMPRWMQEYEGIDWNNLTISCMPPYMLQPVPGRQWLFSMTEGSRIPPGWAESINRCNIERVIVPCEHNRRSFQENGVSCNISVVQGGVDPEEFPLSVRKLHPPYTFLTLADRGSRKGWEEVWQAFYAAFGGKTTGKKDVRLVIKARPSNHPTLPVVLSKAQDADPRIVWQVDDVEDMNVVYAQADCLVLPSRSEGWGMPHREAASIGIPVITQNYSGLDDGHLEEWALVVGGGTLRPIPKEAAASLGEWMVADVSRLAEAMKVVYDFPEMAREMGCKGSHWLHQHQTWDHSARHLIELVEWYH